MVKITEKPTTEYLTSVLIALQQEDKGQKLRECSPNNNNNLQLESTQEYPMKAQNISGASQDYTHRTT